MFKGNSRISFASTKSIEEIHETILEELENLGNSSISSSGNINIANTRYTGFGFTSNIIGRVSERNNKYSLDLDFECKPEPFSWFIAICFFPLGAAIMILPYNAKSEVQRKLDQTLTEIKKILEEN